MTTNDPFLAVTEPIARKVLTTVDAGLISGMGFPVPGSMCIEAAVCFAYGLPHGDSPRCVGPAVRAYKITLNDSPWSTPQARARGMRAIAIAQLGSVGIDQRAFARIVVEQTIRRIVPLALRAAARLTTLDHAQTLLAAAMRCEQEGTHAAATHAVAHTDAVAADAAHAADYAARAAHAVHAANAAVHAANAAAHALHAVHAVNAAAATHAAAYAAHAAAYVTYVDNATARDACLVARDEVLVMGADICLHALTELRSPGCTFLFLLED